MAIKVAVGMSGVYDTELVYCFEKRGVLMDVDDDNSVIPEITPQRFAELKAAGVKTAVGSSKPELFINRILEHFGISDLFDFVSGATFGEPHADKTVIISRAVNGLGVDNLADAVMVGDRSFDIDGAHGVGLKCIGVLEGGYGDENEFKTAGADWIVDTLADVKDIILK